jgi:hypothetical protein
LLGYLYFMLRYDFEEVQPTTASKSAQEAIRNSTPPVVLTIPDNVLEFKAEKPYVSILSTTRNQPDYDLMKFPLQNFILFPWLATKNTTFLVGERSLGKS